MSISKPVWLIVASLSVLTVSAAVGGASLIDAIKSGNVQTAPECDGSSHSGRFNVSPDAFLPLLQINADLPLDRRVFTDFAPHPSRPGECFRRSPKARDPH